MLSFLWFIAGMTAGVGVVLGVVYWLDYEAARSTIDQRDN